MPAPHAVSPLAIPPSPRNMRLVTSQDLYTSINATLASKDNRPSTPGHHIKADEYAVPAPPPPSPTLIAGRAPGDEWTTGATKSDGNETNGNWKPLGFVVACDGSPGEKERALLPAHSRISTNFTRKSQ
ncbi:hypothetical protein AUP68_01599 [Ilyonectria robusta]